MRDELGQGPRPLEHERVDRDALLRAALHLAEGLGDRAAGRRVAELDLAVLEMGGRLAVGDDDDLLVRRRLAGQDPARQQQAVLEVRAVLVAVPGQLGQGAGPDLAGVVGEPDDRQVVARVLRADERVERDRDLLGRQEAAAQQHRATHVDEQDRRRPGHLLGPVDLEVVRREVGHRARPRRAGAFSSRASALVSVAAQVEMERVAELVRLRRLVALAAAARPVDAVAAERVALEPREQVVEHLLADLAAAPRASARAGRRRASGSRPPRAAEQGRRGHRDRARPRRRAVAHLGAIDPGEVAGALDVGQRVLQPLHRLEPADLRQARHRARAVRRHRTEPDRRGRRGAAGRGSRRALARSKSSRSSRSSASIIDSSSARCSGVIERRSDCIAAIRWASWSMMSSKLWAPGKNRPCLARNSRTSGSRPPMRSRISSLRSRTISRFAARSSGVMERMASLIPPTNWSSTCLPSRSTSSSKRARASGSRKSYSCRSRMRSPTSRGRASSWSSRLAATSRRSFWRSGSVDGRGGGAGFGVSGGGVRGGLVRVGCLRVGRVRGGRVRVTR